MMQGRAGHAMSLYHLLSDPRDPRSAVAWRWDAAAGEDRLLTWADFQGDVAGLRERIEGEPGGAWLAVAEDAYAFAVSLAALWHTGRSAIAPPNAQPGTLRQLELRAAEQERAKARMVKAAKR